MPVALATTWRPRGEMPRFERLRPLLREIYSGIAVAAPAEIDEEFRRRLGEMPEVRLVIDPGPFCGRYLALREALAIGGSHVHYCDMDRLIHWAETRPDELRGTVEAVRRGDCLIVGRGEYATGTHPQSLQQTEAIVNAVFGHILGRQLDLCGGSSAFSRGAVEFLLRNATPCIGLGTDTEWPVLLWRAGFGVDSIAVDGLEWETADRYRQRAATPEEQRRLAAEVDREAAGWELRVRFAREMIAAGLAALEKPLHQG